MREFGIINRIKKSLWLQSPELSNRKFTEVDMTDVSQIFIFHTLAIVLSVFLLIIEKFISKGKIDNRGKKSNKLFGVPRFYGYVE